jgi:uncharacterized membrane protein
MVRDSYRFWEIDFLRGFAVTIMLLYHFLYDLDFFNLADVELNSGPLLYLARLGASLFILISGIALSISHSRALSKSYREENFSKYLKRGCKLFSMGLFLTLITWIYFPEEYIVFGILHFFGVAALLVYPFLDYKKENLLFGLFFVIIGLYLRGKTFGFSTLVGLGFIPENFTTFDYFPIFPWFGVLLIGVFLGNTVYEYGNRQFKFPYTGDNFFLRLFSSAGKHSLFIYFIHQPILLAFLFLTGLITPASL